MENTVNEISPAIESFEHKRTTELIQLQLGNYICGHSELYTLSQTTHFIMLMK